MIELMLSYAVSIGFAILNLDFSPNKGPEGNIEYLVHLQKKEEVGTLDEVTLDWHQVVDRAFEALAK